jgi:hypothetical protein
MASNKARIKEGMRCIKKPSICALRDNSGSKASNAKMLTNRMDRIPNTLGAQ